MNHILDKLGIRPDHFHSMRETLQRLCDLYDLGWRVQAGKERNDGFAYANEFWVISPDGNESRVFGSFAVLRFLVAKADELWGDPNEYDTIADLIYRGNAIRGVVCDNGLRVSHEDDEGLIVMSNGNRYGADILVVDHEAPQRQHA